jgi:hypothetical protein
MDYRCTPYEIESHLLESLNNALSLLWLPTASVELQQEYVKLTKLATIVANLASTNKRRFMIQQYEERISNYKIQCKIYQYGVLDALLF